MSRYRQSDDSGGLELRDVSLSGPGDEKSSDTGHSSGVGAASSGAVLGDTHYSDSDHDGASLVGRGRRSRGGRGKGTRRTALGALRNKKCMWGFIVGLVAVIVLAIVLHSLQPRAMGNLLPTDPFPPAKALLNTNMTAAELSEWCSSRMARVAQLRASAGGVGPTSALLDLANTVDMLLANVANFGYLVLSTHPNPDVRAQGSACYEMASTNATALGLDVEYYQLFEALDASGAVKSAPPVTVRFLNKTLQGFRRNGVAESAATRDTLAALDKEITSIGEQFETNINNDVRSVVLDAADPSLVAGLPADFVASHTAGGKVTITTDYPDYFPVMRYAENGELRRNMSRLFLNRGYPANIALLSSLIEKRAQYSQLVGYFNFAAFSQADKMARNPTNVRNFIQHVVDLARPQGAKDLQTLLGFKKKYDPSATVVEAYDSSFLANIARQSLFNVDAKEVRSYFTYKHVREGILKAMSRLFALEFHDVSIAPAVRRWDESVEVFDVYSVHPSGDRFIGRMFLDMHPREGKYKHAASFPILNGVSGQQQTEVALVCNFPATGPMEHSQVVTFFHETGHLIHNLLGGVDQTYSMFSGVATEWDFVEAPSQMLEEWAWDTATLQSFARNEAGKVIPSQLVADMRRADEFGQGMGMQQQMFYATLSLDLYSSDPATLDTTTLVQTLQQQISPYPYIPGTHFQCSFGHLVGYAASYYTYAWSLVLAKDLFSKFQATGLYDPVTARSYASKVLAPGGKEDAAVLVDNFLGRPYNMNAFEHWLSSDPTR